MACVLERNKRGILTGALQPWKLDDLTDTGRVFSVSSDSATLLWLQRRDVKTHTKSDNTLTSVATCPTSASALFLLALPPPSVSGGVTPTAIRWFPPWRSFPPSLSPSKNLHSPYPAALTTVQHPLSCPHLKE